MGASFLSVGKGNLLQKLIDRLVELDYSLLIAVFDRVNDAMLDVIDNWINTSEQSRPSSIIFFVDSKCPIKRAIRFKTAFV